MNTIDTIVASLCKYFDWDTESEQANEVKQSLLRVRNEGYQEALEYVDCEHCRDHINILQGKETEFWRKDSSALKDK